MYLMSEGLWDFVTEDKKLDPKATDKEIKKFYKRRNRALGQIYIHVSDAKQSSIDECKTPKESWDALVKICAPSSRARQASMRRNFLQLKLEPGEEMSDFLSRVDHAVRTLRDVKEIIAETHHAYQYLDFLPPEYGQASFAIYHWSDDDFKPAKVADQLLAEFMPTLLVAFNAIRKGAKNTEMSIKDYILRAQDPLVNVVLLEDFAAVLGVSIAAICMGLSSLYESTIPDAVGSILIGGLLGVVAAVIINTNTTALVGRSIPFEKLERINRELETDVMIRAIHDAKCLDLGNGRTRYKAEIDFDGRELTRAYLDKQDLESLLEEMRNMKTMDEVESYMLKHGENVIDMVGAEIDRIETSLKKRNPEIRHCDLEIL
uniref:Zinc transporter 9 n=1 Tax=Strigamia maritima TaxID=126957 RepID=T1IY14_STRMM